MQLSGVRSDNIGDDHVNIVTCVTRDMWKTLVTIIVTLIKLSSASVITVGDTYYYDVTFMLYNRKFELEFHGPGQGMTRDWFLSAYNWGRLSRGATVRLGEFAEVNLTE